MNIDIRFNTKVPITSRTLIISDAFGLGIDDEKEFVIYDNFVLNIKKGDIVYITGDSGSGKTILLKYIKEQMDNISLNDLNIEFDEILIDNIGKNISEAIRILSLVGLNDAYLFLRRYCELSDGQKYRYKIAKLIDSGKDTWVLDEFCSTLDREMAKIISFNIQKLARKLDKTLIVATCHIDLEKDLSPNVRVDKRFENDVKISYNKSISNKCSVTKDLYIKPCSLDDIKSLLNFHYKNTLVSFVKQIYGLYKGNNLIGCIVYTTPKIKLHGRFLVFGKKYLLDKGHPNMDKINQDIVTIARVVIHPKYRSIGLGQKIVRDTLNLTGYKIVETIATMAKYNPFFEKAGMTLVKEHDTTTTQKAFIQRKQILEKYGFDTKLLASKVYNKNIINKLSISEFKKLKKQYFKTIRLNIKDKKKKFTKEQFAEYLTKKIPKSMYYLYWEK